MALNLSKERRKNLEKAIAEAKPYASNDPIFTKFDGACEADEARCLATIARQLLEQDAKEKEDAKK